MFVGRHKPWPAGLGEGAEGFVRHSRLGDVPARAGLKYRLFYPTGDLQLTSRFFNKRLNRRCLKTHRPCSALEVNELPFPSPAAPAHGDTGVFSCGSGFQPVHWHSCSRGANYAVKINTDVFTSKSHLLKRLKLNKDFWLQFNSMPKILCCRKI